MSPQCVSFHSQYRAHLKCVLVRLSRSEGAVQPVPPSELLVFKAMPLYCVDYRCILLLPSLFASARVNRSTVCIYAKGKILERHAPCSPKHKLYPKAQGTLARALIDAHELWCPLQTFVPFHAICLPAFLGGHELSLHYFLPLSTSSVLLLFSHTATCCGVAPAPRTLEWVGCRTDSARSLPSWCFSALATCTAGGGTIVAAWPRKCWLSCPVRNALFFSSFFFVFAQVLLFFRSFVSSCKTYLHSSLEKYWTRKCPASKAPAGVNSTSIFSKIVTFCYRVCDRTHALSKPNPLSPRNVSARVPPPDTEQGSPVGVGVPYWTAATEGEGGGGSGNGPSHPDPLSVSDLPAPLVPFEEFLRGDDGGSVRGGGGGDGGGKRQVGGPAEGEEVVEIEFEPTAFDHPVFIMFSSGTTGLPKCMVHGAGGETLVLLYDFLCPL